MPNDLVATCCFFNPANYASRRRNYDVFRREFDKSGIKLLTIELLFDGQETHFADYDGVLTIRGGDVLWQKERLLQIGIDKLVTEGYGNVVWVDADLVFGQNDWPLRMLQSLESHDCVQSYDLLHSRYTYTEWERVAFAKDQTTHSVGGSWAGTATFWKAVPLFQHCIVGGGDHVMAHVFLDFKNSKPEEWRYDTVTTSQFNQPMKAKILQWARDSWGDWRVGYVEDLTAHLLEHGNEGRRYYTERHAILADFNPDIDVVCEPDGPWRWATNNLPLRNGVANYFQDRMEDAT